MKRKWGGGTKILSNGQAMSIIPKQATGTGDYYLAPSVQFAKVGMGATPKESTYIDENGDNHYGKENLFNTLLKVMPLDIHYSSSNSRDSYTDMGHWRTSFTSRMDFPINEGDIKDKSNFYDTPRDACESGFNDIKESAYRGILKDATSVYDKDHDMCVLKQDGKDIGKFIVWNKSQNRDDVHYIETSTQDFLSFVKNDEEKFVSEQSGIVLELKKEADGSYSYKDAQDILRRYDSKGKLVYIMKEGQEAHLVYDENGKLDKVTGALDNVIDFNYNEDGLVSNIVGDHGTSKLSLNYNDKKLLSAYKLSFMDKNNTFHLFSEMKLKYNDKNLLTVLNSPSRKALDGKTILSSLTYYGYNADNKITSLESDGGVEKISYEANKVTKILPTGKKAVANIKFLDSKQAITNMTDSHISTDLEFNKKGLLSEVKLIQKVENNSSSNIKSNALSIKNKTLNLQIDYNNRGLISSHFLETSGGIKKFKNFEYKTKYNKPTKILAEDGVTFFDFNNKGQLIKKSYLKYDKDMKIKPHSLADIKNEPNYQEITYTYDENGLLVGKKNEITKREKHFYADNHGKIYNANIKKNWFNFSSWWERKLQEWRRKSTPGYIKGVGTFDMRNPNTQTAFVGGAGEGHSHYTVMNYKTNINNNNNNVNSNRLTMDYYFWWQLDSDISLYRKSPRTDPFKKEVGKQLMVIAHSWGGDSAVEASKTAVAGKKVDLLVTVDPVGTGDWNDGARYWIELYADPGRWYGYVKVKWACGWFYCYPKFYWIESQWNDSDWIAWAGGKGWYSSYDKGDAHPDVFWKTKAHHNQFGYLIQEFQKTRPNYNFHISDGKPYKQAKEY